MSASQLTRTTWTDDDGTGTTGTIVNNAELQALYDAVDDLFSPAFTASVGASAFGFAVESAITEAASGTHPLIAGLHVTTPSITGAAATTTEAATVYITGAPTIGVSNYALHVAAGNVRVDGNLFIGDDANASMTAGITINQGAADNEALAIKSSDVAHGMTTVCETDTYGRWLKASATQGGLVVAGFTEGNQAVVMHAYHTTEDGSRGTSSSAAMYFNALKKSGTSAGAPSGDANLFAFASDSAVRAIIDSDGDLHLDSASNDNVWDDHDDVLLLAGMRGVMTGSAMFASFLERARPVLEQTKVVTFNPDGHHFVSTKGLLGLMMDTIRQESVRRRAMLAVLTAEQQGAYRALAQQGLILEA